jgi:1-acyl-sn-glycerol-3-phosphate acyltransferase
LSIRARVEGTPPDPPFFLVSNHLSYLDIIVLFSLVKTTFISKAEVRHWPVLGFMAHTLGILFIRRRNKMDVARVNTEVAKQIDRFKGVVLFPEGKTTSGDSVLPFKPSLLEHPATSDLPVHYCMLSYQTAEGQPSARECVYWWNDEPFGEHIFNFARLKGTEVTVRFGQDPVHSSDRKELAEELHKRVGQAYRIHLSEQAGEELTSINS